jgi:hypothetical protein
LVSPHVAGLSAYLLGKDKSPSPAQVAQKIASLGTADVLKGVPSGTVNLLAFNGFGGGNDTPTSPVTDELTSTVEVPTATNPVRLRKRWRARDDEPKGIDEIDSRSGPGSSG